MNPGPVLRAALENPGALHPSQVLQLQRAVGNRATGRLLTQPIQRKLVVGPADDLYERQADVLAQGAVRSPDHREKAAVPSPVQRRTAHGAEGGPVEETVARSIEQRRGGGQQLDTGVAGSMGRYFDTDFSRVRVHTGSEADTLNRSLNAKAFTTGNDIFFGKGQYSPGSADGQELIAHELTHVVQQGGGDVQRQFVIRREMLVQRDDDEPGLVGNAIGLGDIGGALVEVYEAYSGDESANAILKAITQLAGGLADTTGGVGDTAEGVTGEGVGAWSSLVGGVTSLTAKGTGLMSTLAEYGRSALDYVSSFGYGSDYLGQVGEACSWLGGWAKSASDLVNPYAFYMDLVASGSKAVTGISDGWKAGNALYDLAALVKNASSRETKKAAELLFNLAWWKRTEGYAKSAVGAVEGGAAIFLGPLSKGLTAVMTKAYEGGWSSYILRAIGSSFTSQVFSNAQVKQQVGQDSNNLAATVNPIAANGKIKDIVALCRAAIQLGMADFAKAILAAFNTLSSGSGTRHAQRKQAFVAEVQRVGLAKQLGL
ncbi:MAG: DUF4157 domain-containing protein [Caldilineaceae bacterium]|nr:DUF4157 domain-containing protein [Caldilineaceae bacterium]